MGGLAKTLSIYQSICGLIGMAFGVILLDSLDIFASILTWLVSTTSFAAGILLWRQRKNAVKLSIFAQTFQIPTIYTSAIAYRIGVGFPFMIGLDYFTADNGTISTEISNDLQIFGFIVNFSLNNEPLGTSIGLNLSAIFALLLSIICYQRVRPRDAT